MFLWGFEGWSLSYWMAVGQKLGRKILQMKGFDGTASDLVFGTFASL